MKKVLALFLCLVLVLIPLSSVAAFADPPEEGYVLDEENKIYTVYTADGLLAVIALINADSEKFGYDITLANDIDLAGKEYTPLVPTYHKTNAPNDFYSGTFDGAGHTIRNIATATDYTTRYRALIGVAGNGCIVTDLTIIDGAFYGLEFVSPVIGAAVGGDIVVSNVHVSNAIVRGDSAKGNNTAGLCGRFVDYAAGNALFENCTVDATISAFKNAAGICGGEASSGALNVTISNCVVAGEIETTVTKAKQGGTVGFFGWTNGVNLTIENSACLATLKGAVNECGFVNNLLRASTITMTNSIGIGKPFGTYNTGDMNVTFTNCASIDLDADLKAGTTTSLWDTVPASAVPGTLTIDGDAEDFLTATMNTSTIGNLKYGVEYLCKDNAELLAKAIELVDATILKLSGVSIEGFQTSKIDEVANTLSIRLAGTIDAHYTQFGSIGFDIAYNEYAAEEVELSTVYTAILANEDGNMETHNAAEFDADYIFALTLEDVPAVGTCIFTVTPFVKSELDGPEVYKWTGTTYVIIFVDGAYAESMPVVGGI